MRLETEGKEGEKKNEKFDKNLFRELNYWNENFKCRGRRLCRPYKVWLYIRSLPTDIVIRVTYYNDCVPLTPDLFVILVFSIRFQTTVLEAWTRFDRFKPKIKAVVVTDCLIISTLVIFYKYCNLWQLTNYLFWTCRYAASNYFSFGPIYLFLRFFFFFFILFRPPFQ